MEGGGGSVDKLLHMSGTDKREEPKSDVTLFRLLSVGFRHISGGGGKRETASGG